MLSPIYLDNIQESVTVPDFLAAINLVLQKFGPPPFGNLLSANANPSTLANWGPGLNGEPYYAGYFDARGLNGGYKYGAPGGTPKDDQFVRSAMYGDFLSGGLAGHVNGAEGIWGADIEPAAPVKMWES